MSRFEEVVNEAIGEVVLGEQTFRAETLAEHIAQAGARAPGRPPAEVTVEARYPEHKPCAGVAHPHPGALYTLHGVAVATARGTPPADRRHRAGHDRVPVRPGACRRGRLASASLRPTASALYEIERILEAVPVATHNQRGLGTLHIGCPEDCARSMPGRWCGSGSRRWRRRSMSG